MLFMKLFLQKILRVVTPYTGVRADFNFKEENFFQGNFSRASNYKFYSTKTFVTDKEDFLKEKIKDENGRY